MNVLGKLTCLSSRFAQFTESGRDPDFDEASYFRRREFNLILARFLITLQPGAGFDQSSGLVF